MRIVYGAILTILLTGIASGQHILLAGGGLSIDSDYFWHRLVQLAGLHGMHIGVITAGRDDPQEAAQAIILTLEHFGARAEWIPITNGDNDSANDPLAANSINQVAAVFIDDGYPHVLVRLLQNRDGTDGLVLTALREKLRNGVIAGSGGGAAILSSGAVPVSGTSYSCLVGGSKSHADHFRRRREMAPRRRPSKADGQRRRVRVRRPIAVKDKKPEVDEEFEVDAEFIPKVEAEFVPEAKPEAKPEAEPDIWPEPEIATEVQRCQYIQGLGFLDSWMIEPRFNDDNFFGRVIRVLLDHRGGKGTPSRSIGIDREMALAIYRIGSPDEFAEVLGSVGGVTFINATAADYDRTATSLNISNVDVTFITQDDRIILNTDEVLPAPWKSELHGDERHVVAECGGDVFHPQVAANQQPYGSFHHAAKRLFNSALSLRIECQTPSTSLGRRLGVVLDRRLSEAFHRDSPTTTEHLISYAHLRVDIHDIV